MSAIIARERMSFYAYLGVGEAVAKLAVVFLLLEVQGADRLKLYATLLLLVQLLILLAYVVYCRSHFEECHFRRVWDKRLIREMGHFIGFNLFGCFSYAAGVQGANIVLNFFFGPAVNAARAVAVQVSAAVSRLSDGLMTAVRPQVVKSYAAGDSTYMFLLVEQSSKFAFFLMLLLALPVILNIDPLLRLWLKTPPAFSSVFAVLTIIDSMIGMMSQPLSMIANATGNIKRSQVYGRCFMLAVLPIAYVLFKFRLVASPTTVFVLLIISDVCYWSYSFYDVRKQVKLNVMQYVRSVILPILKVLTCTLVLIIPLSFSIKDGRTRFISLTIASVILTSATIYFLGMERKERKWVVGMVRNKLSNNKKYAL